MTVLDFINHLLRRQKPSGTMARQRLQLVLAHDRSDLNPELLDQMRREILEVVQRYVEIDIESCDVSLETEDRVTALLANPPHQGVPAAKWQQCLWQRAKRQDCRGQRRNQCDRRAQPQPSGRSGRNRRNLCSQPALETAGVGGAQAQAPPPNRFKRRYRRQRGGGRQETPNA